MVDVPLMQALLKALPEGAAPAAGRRRRPAALGRAGAGAGRHHRLRRGAGGAPDRGVPPGRREPDRHQRPPDQPRQDAGPGKPQERLATSTSSRRPTRRPGVAKLLAMVRDRIPRRFGLDPVRDVQVLCPMNRGGLGARSLNIELQAALNPPGEARVERFGWTFCARRQGHAGRATTTTRRSTTATSASSPDRPGGRRAGRRLRRAGRSPTTSASSTSWCWPTPPRSTRARARSTRRWSSRSPRSTTPCCSAT